MKTYNVRKTVEYWDVEAKDENEAIDIVLGTFIDIEAPSEYDEIVEMEAYEVKQ